MMNKAGLPAFFVSAIYRQGLTNACSAFCRLVWHNTLVTIPAYVEDIQQNGVRMKFDSIKSRLLLMTLICVLGMVLMVANQHFFTKTLFGLQAQHSLLLNLEKELLQLRRHEKDFLLRHQLTYFQKFTSRAERFNTQLSELSPLLSQYDLPVEQTGELAKSMYDYQQLFQQVVTLQSLLGLHAQSGLQGKLNNLEASMGTSSFFSYGSDAYPLKVGLQLATRSYLLDKDSFHRQNVKQALEKLSQCATTENDAQALALIKQYDSTFSRLSDAYTSMGLTHEEGLQGEFRRQAHDVEEKLKSVGFALQPMIESQQQKIKIVSLSVAAGTSVALVLLLVKSFATFQRAFANFVMFFYRCKRQYQKIDTRKLGFSEFKSLAELANEMVESRRDIESKLAKAEAKLEKRNSHSA